MQLQLRIGTSLTDPLQPNDIATQSYVKLILLRIYLNDERTDNFTTNEDIEVEYAKEEVITTIESNSGVITNAL